MLTCPCCIRCCCRRTQPSNMALAQRSNIQAASMRTSTSSAVPKPVCSAPRVVRSVRVAPSCATSSSGRVAVVAHATGTKEQEAQARWTQQVKDGIVMNVSNKTAGEMMAEGWVLLDVRPPGEVDKVGVKGKQMGVSCSHQLYLCVLIR
eukprot:GHUV01055400.1.p2 GENE.GHUV01055400.1~~GHUV01055400.1.p2  ORF type:complete len:149 (-),score=21.95 GHUV01055400.1:171-617(-)